MEAVKRQLKKWTGSIPYRQIARLLISAVIGILLSGVIFEERLAPFGAAFAAGVPDLYLLPAGFGAAGGSFLLGSPYVTLKNVGGIGLIVLFRLTLPRIFPKTHRQFLLPAIGFFSVFLSAGIVSFADSPGLESMLLSFCEGAVAAAAAAFWRRVFVLLPDGRRLTAASPGDSAALLFAGAMLLLSCDRFSIGGIGPARIAASFFVMLLGMTAGLAPGGMAGVCAGTVLGFRPEQSFLVYALPTAGVLCGVTASAGKPAVAGAFWLCDLLFLLLKGGEAGVAAALIESTAAALLFLVLPKRAVAFAEDFFRPLSQNANREDAGRLLAMRLKRKAGAVAEIADSLDAVNRVFQKTQSDPPEPLPALVRSGVCEDCEKYAYCWDATRILTERAFRESAETLRKTGRMIPELLPARLKAACLRQSRLSAVFTEKYCEETARAAVKEEVKEAKAAAAEQFRQTSALLADAAVRAEEEALPDPALSQAARELLTQAGFRVSSLLVYLDQNGRHTLEAFCASEPDPPGYALVAERIYERTGILFSEPVRERASEDGVWMSFYEKPDLRADFFQQSVSAGSEPLCGDACRGGPDGAGGFICVLSDGMGTGPAAAVDAAMACSLTCRLLRARFSPEAVFRAVNTALLVNAGEEMLTTLDVFSLDLYTGEACFYKAGAAVSVVRTGKKTAVIEHASLPLGIMEEPKWEETRLRLSPGDAVLMMSDGADLLSPSYFKDLFRLYPDADAKKIVTEVLAAAVKRAPVGRRDDITAACVILS